ncbi:EMILIN-2 isoform X1, partial [Silurus meridionalis]
RNWCAFVVHKNVTCAVREVTESVESDSAPCPEHQPHCTQTGIYRIITRPVYKVGYKQVTELEWRCCPGYRGYECMESKDVLPPQVLQEPRPDLLPVHKPQQNVLDVSPGSHSMTQPGQSGQTRHPWTEGGQSGNLWGQHDSHRVQDLEKEVQRLSQTVFDMQSAMTTANANLRIDLQEDASRIILNLLGHLRQPQDALAGVTESIVLPPDLTIPSVPNELQNQVTQLSNAISTNTHTIQGLEAKLQQIEDQMNQLKGAASGTPVPIPSSTLSTECSCQSYIDEKLQALRNELLEGMDIKMADLKNSCYYKVESVKEQCEEQENSYLSLTELLESKEAELRQDIQDLRHLVSNSTSSGLEVAQFQDEIQSLKNVYQSLASAINVTNTKQKALEEALNTRFNIAEKSAEKHCLKLEEKLRSEITKEQAALNVTLESKISAAVQVFGDMQLHTMPTDGQNILEMEYQMQSMRGEVSSLMQHVTQLESSVQVFNESISQSHMAGLYNKLSELEEACGKNQESANKVEEMLSGMDGRVATVERVCGRLEPMSDSLKRIKDGLNKHVNGLWNCVRKLNSTVLTHSTDINTLREHTHTTVGTQHGTTNMPQYTDIAKSHTASITAALLSNGRVWVLNWPACSLDISPFENIWHIVKNTTNIPFPKLKQLVSSVPYIWTAVKRRRDATYFIMTAIIFHCLLSPNFPGARSGLEDSRVVLEKTASVLESGEAGPPGTKLSSSPPQGTNGKKTPVKGSATAPGFSPSSTVSVTAHIRPGPIILSGPVSFSTGLSLLPFSEAVGIIRFNRVLLNDGNHYDPHTGVFTVPSDGLYLLSVVITAQKGERVEAVLSVANRSIQKLETAGAEGDTSTGCLCGGSASASLVLDLRQGQKVGVVKTSGTLAISSSTEVFSTFSGVLLYPLAAKR